jgi:hypothetical protein
METAAISQLLKNSVFDVQKYGRMLPRNRIIIVNNNNEKITSQQNHEHGGINKKRKIRYYRCRNTALDIIVCNTCGRLHHAADYELNSCLQCNFEYVEN